jgi:DNA-binding GntR family transcriptional regulator
MQRAARLDDRQNLSELIATQLRDMIVDGTLPAGERINEVHLAQSLGISRTPLREALARLGQEGALIARPRIGWFVQPLTLDEFQQIYPIRSYLDPEALRMAGVPSPARLARLERLNDRLTGARDANAAILLDDQWHLELIAACPNGVLLDLIRTFIRRTRRYEIAFMRGRRHVAGAAMDHRFILAALRRRDLDDACAALRRNLETGAEPIAAWLRERASKGG